MAEFASPRKTKKDYAEAPFTLRDFWGKQFTIVESLSTSDVPRTVTKESNKTGSQYEVAAIKVTDGLFEKDLHLFGSEYTKLCAALPDSLLNLKGVTMADNKGRLEYICVDRPDDVPQGNTTTPEQPRDTDGNGGNGTADKNERDGNTLAQAVLLQNKLGSKVDYNVMTKIIESIVGTNQANVLGLFKYAKDSGLIFEKDGGYLATVV